MKLRTGIDIIEISRVRDSIQRQSQAFLNRVFSQEEQTYCNAYTADPATRFAGRFAAKEAVVKALGTGIGAEIGWLDVEIRAGSKGEPKVHLSPRATAHFNTPQLSLSISHCREYATAFAIWMIEETP